MSHSFLYIQLCYWYQQIARNLSIISSDIFCSQGYIHRNANLRLTTRKSPLSILKDRQLLITRTLQ